MINSSMSIYYAPNNYRSLTRVAGNTIANDGLLKALANYGARSTISPYIAQAHFFDEFKNSYATGTSTKTFYPITQGDIPALKKSGLYMQPDVLISKMIWSRAFMSPDSFSICGLVHALAGMDTAEEVAQLVQAPLQEWDAIICTSNAAKRVMENLFAQWHDYLRARYKEPIKTSLQLPILPLGIHPEAVSAPELHEVHRNNFRRRYDIAEQDYVVLFMGRLFFYEKAHPIPMYLALEALAQRIGSQSRVHFVQAGWFDKEEHKIHYQEAARLFSPSVKVHFINDLDTEAKKKAIWPGADVFMSLSDNIQESFGITPLEAMANKLPVVVSDWDGYRDTVRHRVDGFLIPTVLPPSGCGADLSLGYLSKGINWWTYAGLTAQMAAVDIGACVNALWQLYLNPELRQQMGAAGYRRIQEDFHWNKVLPRYDALWDELSARRHAATNNDKTAIAAPPMLADPFHTFSGHASAVLKPNYYFKPGETSIAQLDILLSNPLGGIGAQQIVPVAYLQQIVTAVQHKTMSTQDVVDFIAALDRTISSGIVVRSLTYLLKYDFIRIN
ncbi:glycosyltransferase family 4 protein [Legionella saoudiensis]|uniref:glycosyltransferase family 4 protein n=1 Tax=Legionella saoudiensis TaxID=1750561 RepID=UPI000731AEE1|nr:glycosyltransferase family 4 protein [Legionella saoudiensis]